MDFWRFLEKVVVHRFIFKQPAFTIWWDKYIKYALYIAAFLPAMVWGLQKVWFDVFLVNMYLNISRLFALIATGSLVVSLILVLKIPISIPVFKQVRLLPSIDKLYKEHQMLGVIAVISIFLHWIFLIIHYKGDIFTINLIRLPGAIQAYNLGLLAFLILLGMVLIAYLFNHINYRWWVVLHSILSVGILFGWLHILQVSSDYQNIFLLKLSIYVYVGAGVVLWFLRVLGKLVGFGGYKATVVQIDDVSDGVYKFVVRVHEKGAIDRFRPGHYAFIQALTFKGRLVEHPYTIVAVDQAAKTLTFVIKPRGRGSGRIVNLKKGDQVILRGPFGILPELLSFRRYKIIYFITAGIGINVAVGALQNLNMSDTHVKLLFITKEKYKNLPFLLTKTNRVKDNNIEIITWNTSKRGRPTFQDILKYLNVKSGKNSLIIFAGPNSLVKYLRAGFESLPFNTAQAHNGIDIYYESIQFNKPIIVLRWLIYLIALVTGLIYLIYLT